MRWLEYGQRLRSETRGVLVDESGAVAPLLLAAGTAGGAASLGVPAGRVAVGSWADFAAVDLTSPLLSPALGNGLLEAVLLGADDSVVAASCVGGHWDRDWARRPRSPG
jgi:cytosine/adenosine deaminase-related metal-dependent hydrolase